MPLPPLRSCALLLALLFSPMPGLAQPVAPRDELLALVPADVGFCVVLNDLRGHAQKWDRSPWLQSFRQLALVQTIVNSPEARQLAGLEGELKKNLDIDWPTLRDDIFGDAVVLAYRPGTPKNPESEQGMIALRAAKPKVLARLVDRLNDLQTASGELKSLEAQKHRGATYYRRVHAQNTHFYYLHGSLLPKNPHLADHIIGRALKRRGDASLLPLDDSEELAAHDWILQRARLQ